MPYDMLAEAFSADMLGNAVNMFGTKYGPLSVT